MNILNYMGNTPMVKIRNSYGDKFGQIYVKLEEFDPGGSIKARVGLQMVEDAERDGILKKGDTIIEATGGNTGIGLAMAASIKGIKTVLCIPDTYSKEKIETLKYYGAKIVLADHNIGNDCHIVVANKLMKENKDYKNLNQFANPSNPKAHYNGTGLEILKEMNKHVDYFVAAIGSGGTIMGVGNRLKEEIDNVKIIGVQPKGCDILNNVFVPHKIQAIAVGIVSSNYQVLRTKEKFNVYFWGYFLDEDDVVLIFDGDNLSNFNDITIESNGTLIEDLDITNCTIKFKYKFNLQGEIVILFDYVTEMRISLRLNALRRKVYDNQRVLQ